MLYHTPGGPGYMYYQVFALLLYDVVPQISIPLVYYYSSIYGVYNVFEVYIYLYEYFLSFFSNTRTYVPGSSYVYVLLCCDRIVRPLFSATNLQRKRVLAFF